MTAYDSEALWNKSKVFAARAVAGRDADEQDSFALWAALSLEILGKSVLARTSPTLIADPTHFGSMLAACGLPKGETRTITAKTTYERLPALVKEFDEKACKFAMLMANRRNEELHSGGSPTAGLDQRAWVPEFWRVAQILIVALGRQLSDWVPEDEAAGVEVVLRDAGQLLNVTVQSRIQDCAKRFDKSYPPGSMARLKRMEEIAAMVKQPLAQRLFSSLDGDRTHAAKCPACQCSGLLVGMEWERTELDRDWTGEDMIVLESVVYVSEGFECIGCGLRLRNREEIQASGVPSEVTVEEEVEADFEPDYGND